MELNIFTLSVIPTSIDLLYGDFNDGCVWEEFNPKACKTNNNTTGLAILLFGFLLLLNSFAFARSISDGAYAKILNLITELDLIAEKLDKISTSSALTWNDYNE